MIFIIIRTCVIYRADNLKSNQLSRAQNANIRVILRGLVSPTVLNVLYVISAHPFFSSRREYITSAGKSRAMSNVNISII